MIRIVLLVASTLFCLAVCICACSAMFGCGAAATGGASPESVTIYGLELEVCSHNAQSYDAGLACMKTQKAVFCGDGGAWSKLDAGECGGPI